jgi:hypothetical protein
VTIGPVLAETPPATWFFDDFFYYAVIAERFVESGRLEFYPGVLTNGYHPLWMALLIALRALLRTDPTFLGGVSALACALMLSTWLVLRRLLLQLGEPVGAALGLLVAAPCVLLLGTSGLEVVLTLPLLGLLLLLLVAQPLTARPPAALAGIGGLAALTILSRLDAALIVGPLLAAAAWQSRPRARAAAWIGLGLLPVALYVGANALAFDTWLPVSGQAKQLKTQLLPSLAPLREGWTVAPAVHLPLAIVLPAWLGGVIALVLGRSAEPRQRGLIAVLLASPILFYAVHCTLSDWQLWYWYIYPWTLPAACGIALLYGASPSRWHRLWVIPGLLLALCTFRTTAGLQQRSSNWLHALDAALAERIAAAPERHSMGDCAGGLAFMSKQPILQTEGLVMDRAFLAGIRAERDLSDVLRERGIDVHITIRAERDGDCWNVDEPALAGPSSPRMHGRFCGPPRFEVTAYGVTAYAFDVPKRAP